MSSPASKYDIDRLRKRMSAKIGGRRSDPFEFRPPKVATGETVKYRFFILPDLQKGDKCHGGTASQDMDLFVLKHGQHWINSRPYGCPRLYNEEECDICQVGFDALNEIPKSEKEKRAAIIKQWLSSSVFGSNIFFPAIDANPEEVRGKVMWYNAPKQVFDIWYAAVNRDNAGDEDDPEAHGVIYNPYAAFLFQLTIKNGGSFNDYKSSKFIAANGAQPIVQLANKKPDEKAIQEVLDSRHDLFLKIEVPNPQKITQLCQTMLHGGDVADEIPATTPDMVEGSAAKATVGKKMPDLPDDDDEPKKNPPAKPAQTKPAQAKPAPVVEESADADDLADEAPPPPKKSQPAKPVQAKPAPAPVKAKPAPEDDDDTAVPAADDDDDDDIAGILSNLKKGKIDDDD